MANTCFTDCGDSQDVPNAIKKVLESFQVDSVKIVELKVSYTCQTPYLLVPESADTVHSCLTGGSWNKPDDFECLKGWLQLNKYKNKTAENKCSVTICIASLNKTQIVSGDKSKHYKICIYFKLT